MSGYFFTLGRTVERFQVIRTLTQAHTLNGKKEREKLTTKINFSFVWMATRKRRRGETKPGSDGSSIGREQPGVRVDPQLMTRMRTLGFMWTTTIQQTGQELRSPRYAQPLRQWQSSQEVGQTKSLHRLSLRWSPCQHREDPDMQARSSASAPWMFTNDPATLPELVIPDVWTLTGGAHPRPLLNHDSGPGQRQREMVYAAEGQLRHLGQSDNWFMDGNCHESRCLWTALYDPCPSWRVCGCLCIPVCVPFWEDYTDLPRAVSSSSRTMQIYADSRVVNTDIELAAIQSVALVLGPHVTPQGCVYQLSQSTGREIQAVGKTDFYRTNDDSRHFCGILDALAFFPEDKVQVGMTYVR